MIDKIIHNGKNYYLIDFNKYKRILLSKQLYIILIEKGNWLEIENFIDNFSNEKTKESLILLNDTTFSFSNGSQTIEFKDKEFYLAYCPIDKKFAILNKKNTDNYL